MTLPLGGEEESSCSCCRFRLTVNLRRSVVGEMTIDQEVNLGLVITGHFARIIR